MDDKKLKNDISISLADSINGIIVVDSVIQPSPNSTSVLKRLTEETSPVTVPVPDEEIEIPIEFDKCLTVDVSHIGKVCRTCLCEKPNMHSLFETWEVETIAEMLTSFAAVQLSFGDGLPESVCKECIELVSKCFAFKQLCERSESILRCFITQGHLQGMKLDPDISVIAGTISKTINERENRPANENEQDLINYDVYLDGEFQDSASPEQPSLIINEVLGKDNTETLNVNTCPPAPKKNLSIITNPAITISPNSQLKEKENKKKPTKKNKTLNNTITSKDTNDLNNLSRINKNKLVKKLQQTSPVADINESTGTKIEREKTELSFTCGSCGKQFPNNHRLLRHERIHQEEKLYSCDVCKKGFNEPRDYHRHLVKHSLPKDENAPVANENTFGCPNCHLTFSSEGDLHIHSSVHLATGDKIVCQHCKKEFATTLQLKRHVRIHLSDKPHKCSFCQKGFAEMGSLTRHFRLHTGETRERKHVCDVCNKAYYDRNSLRIHLRIHTGEKPWECLDCGKRFIDSRLLNSHRRTHSDIKPYACNTCDRRFKHESTLTTHKRTHTGEKPYVCSVCGNAFVQSSNLSLHMRTHTRERPYGCQFCKKRFSSSSALTTHTRTHTGEKPYVCPICFKRFARYDMRSHMRTHTGEKPFGCSLCGRHFVSQSQLQQHLRMHTGERPFVCIICGKGCTTSFYLKKHMSKTHNMVTVNLNPSLPKEDQKLDQTKFIAPADCIISPKMEEKPVNSDIVISSNQVLSIAPNNTIALTGNNLNVVSVTNSGELSMTANDLGISTLTDHHQMISTEVNVGTIVTNTLIADDKLYQIDPELLRIHHVSANLVHSSQLTISELTNANS